MAGKHLFAVLISSLMLAGLFSVSSFAEDNDTWANLTTRIEQASDNVTITLDQDYTAGPSDGIISIPSGKSITIDLAGHKLDRSLGKESEAVGHGGVIEVAGMLTIKDSGGDGMITGGYGERGGGIYIGDGGKCMIEGGSIEGNKAEKGGGIYIDAGGELAMIGGRVTGNEADVRAGGIWCGSGGNYSIGGAPRVEGNRALQGANLLLDSSAVIHVTSMLNNSAKIDLVAQSPSRPLTKELTESRSAVVAPDVFTYDGASERLEVRDEELYLVYNSSEVTVGDWQALQNAINDEANRGKVIRLANDITASEDDDRLLVDDKNVIIDLGGCRLDRKLAATNPDGHVFEISNGSTLTIRDSAGSSQITGGYADQGGAVCIREGCICNVEGGAFLDNRAGNSGGAFFVGGTLNMTGGVIAGNTARTGGGVCFTGKNQFVLGGSPAIRHNTGGNVYLAEGNKIIISGALTPVGQIGVTLESGQGVFTSGLSDTVGNSIDSFSSDNPLYIVTQTEGDKPEAQLFRPGGTDITVTFKVVNGLWNDKTDKDKTVTLTAYDGDYPSLKDSDIPAVGGEPADSFKAGSWDVTPDPKKEITEDTTYTYTYVKTDTNKDTRTHTNTNTNTNEKTPKPTPVKITGTLFARMRAKGRRSLVLTWNKINGAEGYDIFFTSCGKNKVRKVKTIKGNQTFKWVKKSLKAKKAYKAVVKAYVTKDGRKTYVKMSPMVHAYTSGGSKTFTNPGSVTVKKTALSLRTGKTSRIKADVTGLQKGKKLILPSHAPKLRYVSSDKKIAAVSRSGKITARSKGSCKVYVIAANGTSKTITVTVK